MPLRRRRPFLYSIHDLTLFIEFHDDGFHVHNAKAPVSLEFRRASSHWDLNHAHQGDLLIEHGNDDPCYDLSSGLWLRGADTNLIAFNVGDNSATQWTKQGISASSWDSTYEMFNETTVGDGKGALKLTSSAAANNLYTEDTGVALADTVIYLIGFLVGIPGATSATDPTSYVVPHCGTTQNNLTGNICSGDPDASSGNVRYRHLRTDTGIAYFEVWEKITADATDTFYPGLSVKTGTSDHIVYVCAPTMYLFADAGGGTTHGGGCWRGCMVRPDGDAVTTAIETLNVLSSNIYRILPMFDGGEFAIVMEFAHAIHTDDYVAADTSDSGYCMSWRAAHQGHIRNIFDTGRWAAYLRDAGANISTADFAYGANWPPDPYASKWFGFTSQEGLTGDAWLKDTEFELFKGSATDDFDAAQPVDTIQYTDGIQVGGKGAAGTTVSGTDAVGSSMDGVLRTIKIWDHLQAPL